MTKTFRDLGVDGALCDALATTGITHPFPIQELTLPLALTGNDLIGQARTGTGKTLAFGLPLLQRLDPDKKATQALVIVPTRELCLQVFDDLKIGSTRGLTSIAVYGGVGFDEQIDALTTGVHVVVGTPGRLLDHLNRGNLDLSNVTQLVLDEADEMLDMGFLPDVERLVEACQGEDRHTMLFSATMPTAIVKLARRYMDHPTFTRADTEAHETAPNVTQHFLQVHRMDKPRVLARILQSPNRGGVYVFVRTKHMADRLVNELEDLGVPSVPVHGDLRQSSREKNLDRFRSGKATVLVATEVAARGLDVHGVTHVVNYDCPDDEKMYLHRIGRTARAGEAGVAVTFAEFNEVDKLNVIRKRVGAENAQVEQVFSTSDVLAELFDLPDTKPWDHLSKKTSKGGSRGDGSRDSGRDTTRGRSGSRDGSDRPSGRGDRSRDAGSSDAASSSRAANERSRSDRRPGRSDGRSKNQRQTEGAGGGHDASRSRSQADATAPAADTSTDTTSGVAATDTTSDSPATGRSSERARSRTRTRSRTSSTAGGDDRRGGRDETSAEDRSDSGSSSTDDQRHDEGAGTSGSGQQRRRARGGRSARSTSRGTGSASGGDRDRGSDRGEDRGSDRGEDGRSDRGGDRDRGAASGRDRGTKARSGGRQRAGSGSASGAADSRSRARGGSSTDGTDTANGSGSKGSDGRRSQGRGGGNTGRSRKGGAGRGDRSRNTTDRADTEPIELQRRGRSARGDGQPQPARRVKVEHLP